MTTERIRALQVALNESADAEKHARAALHAALIEDCGWKIGDLCEAQLGNLRGSSLPGPWFPVRIEGLRATYSDVNVMVAPLKQDGTYSLKVRQVEAFNLRRIESK